MSRPVQDGLRPTWRNPVARLRAAFAPAPEQTTTDYTVPRMLRQPHGGAEMVPSIADAPNVLRADVSKLNRAGGLDEGNARVFDTKIRAWTSTWAVAASAEHEVRQNVLRQREMEARRHADTWQERLRETESALNSVDDRLAALERRLAEDEDRRQNALLKRKPHKKGRRTE